MFSEFCREGALNQTLQANYFDNFRILRSIVAFDFVDFPLKFRVITLSNTAGTGERVLNYLRFINLYFPCNYIVYYRKGMVERAVIVEIVFVFDRYYVVAC